MRWIAGRHGPGQGLRPAGARLVPEFDAAWTVGWPAARVRAVSDGLTSMAVVGDCHADARQLAAGLVAARQDRWRELTCWGGSYLTVVQDQDQDQGGGRLAILGDLAGLFPVYYRHHGSALWWSTAATALAALGGAGVDPVALAVNLVVGQPDVLAHQSLLSDVRRVPSGFVLLGRLGGTAHLVAYEEAQYAAVSLRASAPRVRQALDAGVAARVAGGRAVSADVAGVDSTTVACLAASRTRVTAVTVAGGLLADDDLAHARRAVAATPGMTHRIVVGDIPYYQDMDRMPRVDSPSAYVATAAIKRAVLERAVDAGGVDPLHLTGVAGDGVLSAASGYVADLLRERRFMEAWRHAHGHARLRRGSPLQVVARAWPASRVDLHGAWRLAAAELRAAPGPWVPHAQRPVSWSPLLAVADWMPTETRQALADALEGAAEADVPRPASLAAWTERQDLHRVAADVVGLREIGWEQGVDIATPYLDTAVIRACLAVPAAQRGAPTRYKPLLAEAFQGCGVLPPSVLERATKGGMDGPAYQGLITHAALLRDLLGPDSQLACLGLLEPAGPEAMLRRAERRQPTALSALHAAVAAEVWLRQLDLAQARWWEVDQDVEAAADGPSRAHP